MTIKHELTGTELRVLRKINQEYEETGTPVTPWQIIPPAFDIDPIECSTACKNLIKAGLLKLADENSLPEFIPINPQNAK